MRLLLCLKPWLLVLLLKWELEIVGCADDDPNKHTNASDANKTAGDNPTSSSDQNRSPNKSQNLLENSDKFQVVTDLKSREFQFDILDDTQESGDQNQPKSYPTDRVELLRHTNGYAYLCLFKPGVKCTEFRYQGKTVWKRDPSLLDQYYPYSMYFKPYSRELTVWLNWKWYYLYSYSDVHNSYVLKYSMIDGKSDGVPTPKFSSSDQSQVASLDFSSQTTPEPKPTDDEKPKDSTPFPEFEESGEDQQEPSSTKIEDTSGTESFQPTEEPGDSQSTFTSQPESSQPASSTQDSLTTPSGAGLDSTTEPFTEESKEYSSGSVQPGESESSTESSQPAKSASSTQDSSSNPPQDQETRVENDDQAQGHPFNLKITTEGIDGISGENEATHYYLKKHGKFYKFEFNDGSRCVELRYQDQQVYKHDKDKHKDQFPTSIFLHLDSKRVYLALKDSMFIYTQQDNKWTGVETNLVQLDISKKDSTSEYQCIAKDNIGIYTANGNFLFQEVIRKKPKCGCGSDYTFIQATDPGEYVYKVVRDGTDLTKSITKATLYLLNGDIKKFQKTGSCCRKSWSELNPEPQSVKISNIDTNDHFKDIKILTKGSDGSAKENDSSHHFVNIRSLKKEVLEFEFQFTNQVKCIALKYKDHYVWKHQINSNYPKAIYLCDSGFLILLEMKDDKFLLLGLTTDNNWESESLPGAKNLSESNIKIITKDGANNTKENDNSKYDFTKLDFALEYEFKEGAECVEIKCDGQSVWKLDSEDSTDYPSYIYIMSGNNVFVFL